MARAKVEFTAKGPISDGTAPGLFVGAMKRAMTKVLVLMEGETKKTVTRKKLVNFGQLRNSIKAFGPTVSQERVKGQVIAGAIHALAQEGGAKKHFPNVTALQTWTKRKGIKPKAKVGKKPATANRQLAFLIAREISKVGLKAKNFFKDTVDKNRRKVTKIFQDAVRTFTG